MGDVEVQEVRGHLRESGQAVDDLHGVQRQVHADQGLQEGGGPVRLQQLHQHLTTNSSLKILRIRQAQAFMFLKIPLCCY